MPGPAGQPCSMCGMSEMRLLWCGGCGQAQYCSTDCQMLDWRQHQQRCGAGAGAPHAGAGGALAAADMVSAAAALPPLSRHPVRKAGVPAAAGSAPARKRTEPGAAAPGTAPVPPAHPSTRNYRCGGWGACVQFCFPPSAAQLVEEQPPPGLTLPCWRCRPRSKWEPNGRGGFSKALSPSDLLKLRLKGARQAAAAACPALVGCPRRALEPAGVAEPRAPTRAPRTCRAGLSRCRRRAGRAHRTRRQGGHPGAGAALGGRGDAEGVGGGRVAPRPQRHQAPGAGGAALLRAVEESAPASAGHRRRAAGDNQARVRPLQLLSLQAGWTAVVAELQLVAGDRIELQPAGREVRGQRGGLLWSRLAAAGDCRSCTERPGPCPHVSVLQEQGDGTSRPKLLLLVVRSGGAQPDAPPADDTPGAAAPAGGLLGRTQLPGLTQPPAQQASQQQERQPDAGAAASQQLQRAPWPAPVLPQQAGQQPGGPPQQLVLNEQQQKRLLQFLAANNRAALAGVPAAAWPPAPPGGAGPQPAALLATGTVASSVLGAEGFSSQSQESTYATVPALLFDPGTRPGAAPHPIGGHTAGAATDPAAPAARGGRRPGCWGAPRRRTWPAWCWW